MWSWSWEPIEKANEQTKAWVGLVSEAHHMGTSPYIPLLGQSVLRKSPGLPREADFPGDSDRGRNPPAMQETWV